MLLALKNMGILHLISGEQGTRCVSRRVNVMTIVGVQHKPASGSGLRE